MTDLERLIRERQDVLRGRPRDWLDDVGEWRRNTDWVGFTILIGFPMLIVLGLALVMWLS